MSGGFGLPVLDLVGAFGKIGKAYSDGYETSQRKAVLSNLGQAIQGGNYGDAAKVAFGAGDLPTGLGLLKLGEEQVKQKRTEAADADFARAFGGGFGPGGPVGAPGGGPAPRPNLPSFLDTDGASGNYITGLFKRESNNDTMAQAPTSSARGLGQFTRSTWNNVAAQNPDLGLVPVGNGQDGRTDPDQMLRATKALTATNEGLLSSAGLPVTDATRYALHFLGAGGGRRLVAGAMRNPDAPASSYASPDAVAANRNVFFDRGGRAKSAGEVMSDFQRSFGGGQVTPQAPIQVASSDPGFAPAGPPLPMQAPPMPPGRPMDLAAADDLDDAPAAPVRPPQMAAPSPPILPPGASGLNPGRPPQVVPPQMPPPRPPIAMPDAPMPGQPVAATPPQAQASADAADMPAPDARPAGFQIPPGPATMSGSVAALPQGLSGAGDGRGPAAPLPRPGSSMPSSSNPSGPVPSQSPPSYGGGAPVGRVMAMPGDGPAQAPQPNAAARFPPGAMIGNVPAQAYTQGSLTQRIPRLMQAVASPNLSEGPRQLANMLLKLAWDETKAPDSVKEFQIARANGWTQAQSPAAYAREKLRDPGQDLNAQIEARAAAAQRYGMQPGTPEFQNYVLGDKPAAERQTEGEKITGAIEARRQAAADMGLQEGTPAYRAYVLGNKIGADRDMSATDKKAIQDADAQTLSAQSTIDMLGQAKVLSKKAYAGPLSTPLSYVTSRFGNEAGVATQDLDNLVTTQALQQLKSIFGGNPTEGERAILLEIQGSSSKPDVVRQRIYDRGIALAQLRLRQNQDKADELRGGTYFRQGGGPAGRREAADGGQPDARALPPPSPPSPSNRPGAVSAGDRFGQLVGSGLSKAQAYERLHSEGY